MKQIFQFDVLIIGSGVAGLACALKLDKNLSVALISKGSLVDGSSWLAQGGIAAVLDEEDSIEAHVDDTLIAGDGLCHKDTVKFVVENGQKTIRWLVDQGVLFTKDKSNKNFHLGQEGGHSFRRILHSADATGKAITRALIKRVKEASNIQIFEEHCAVDLITQEDSTTNRMKCVGSYLLNLKSSEISLFQAKTVVLASGGASKAYLYTSNPDGASGDGIAMAWRKGCRIANMEFNQFHPTCLFNADAKSSLITEAIRGEGGILLLPNGERFMNKFHKDGELAPRDVVARAIDHEMKRIGCDCLYLDISHRESSFIKESFPNVYEECLKYGVDITKDKIPVVPAAHYTCGGVIVSKDGQTDLSNLYVIGESSFTGLHGANRMASNSLLECLVYAESSASSINYRIPEISLPFEIPQWDESRVIQSDENVVISHNWDELRRFMWDYVGIVRTKKRLLRADNRIELLQNEIQEFYKNFSISRDLIELRNLTSVSQLIIKSAQQRKESRRLHYTIDFPDKSKFAKDTILVPVNFAGQEIFISS
jgi:L-aspartate oxidase